MLNYIFVVIFIFLILLYVRKNDLGCIILWFKMQYPINYDFGANWVEKIVPHLDDPRIKKALRVGINDYLSLYPGNKKYKANTCPATYSSRDGYCMLMDRKSKNYIKQLKRDGKLPKKYILLKRKLASGECSDDDDDICTQLFYMEESMTKHLHQWKNIKYNLESYCLFGSCHSYAPTFELTLARLVEPNEEWIIKTSDIHTTVINKSKTKVFDLLYWAAFADINHYMFGDQVEEYDETMGGKRAYLDTH